MINFTALLYIFGGIVNASTTYRLWNSYQESKNEVTKNFIYIGFFLTLGLFILGAFSLFFSKNYFLLKISILIAAIPVFISLAFGVRLFFYLRFEQFHPNFALLTAIIFSPLILLQARYPGLPRITQGVVEWNLHPTAFLFFTIFILIFSIPPAIMFVRSGIKNSKIRVRSFAMAAGFLFGGIGAILNISNFGHLVIILGGIIFLLSFLSIAFAFFFTKSPLE